MCKLLKVLVAAALVGAGALPGMASASGKKSGPSGFTPKFTLPKLPLIKNPLPARIVTIGVPRSTTQSWTAGRWFGLNGFRIWDARRGFFVYSLLGQRGFFRDMGGRMVPVGSPEGLPGLPEAGRTTCPTTGPINPMDPITLPPTDPITLPPADSTPMDPETPPMGEPEETPAPGDK